MVVKLCNANDIILFVQCFLSTHVRFLRFILDIWSCCSFFYWQIAFHCVRIQQFIWLFFLSMNILVVYRLFVLLLIVKLPWTFLPVLFIHTWNHFPRQCSFQTFRPQYTKRYSLPFNKDKVQTCIQKKLKQVSANNLYLYYLKGILIFSIIFPYYIVLCI